MWAIVAPTLLNCYSRATCLVRFQSSRPRPTRSGQPSSLHTSESECTISALRFDDLRKGQEHRGRQSLSCLAALRL